MGHEWVLHASARVKLKRRSGPVLMLLPDILSNVKLLINGPAELPGGMNHTYTGWGTGLPGVGRGLKALASKSGSIKAPGGVARGPASLPRAAPLSEDACSFALTGGWGSLTQSKSLS